MKNNIFYESLIVILLVSVATFGEIVTPESDPNTYDPNTHGTSASAAATVSHGNPSDSDEDSKEWYEYTTEDGWFDWSIEGRVQVGGTANEVDGWISLVAAAVAEAAGPTYSFRISKSVTVTDGTDSDVDDDSESGTDVYLTAYSGVSSSCGAVCNAAIEEGSYSYGFCTAFASGWCELKLH